jgi:hypothetical protein
MTASQEWVLMAFRAKGTAADLLTKVKVVRWLNGDRYIEVLSNA